MSQEKLVSSNDEKIMDDVEYKIYESLEEFEENLPRTVTILTTDCGSKVFLVGTAHVSKESADDVSFVMRNVKPDIVVLELCSARSKILHDDEQNMLKQSKNGPNLEDAMDDGSKIQLFEGLMSQSSAKLVRDVGIAPGIEMRRAAFEAKKLKNCVVIFGDRDIDITVKRISNRISPNDIKIIMSNPSSAHEYRKEDIEAMKDINILTKNTKVLSDNFPDFTKILLHERDQYLCYSLQEAARPKDGQPVRVVGVFGIGHINGIVENWGKVTQQQIAEILES